MGNKKLVKLELKNPRYQKTELKDHASEFILYARYSGFMLEGFNEHLRDAKITPIKSDFMESHRIELETTVDNARVLFQLTKLYPSFSNWRVRAIAPNIDISSVPKPKKSSKANSSNLAKKTAKKPVNKAKSASPKKVAKKKTSKSRKK